MNDSQDQYTEPMPEVIRRALDKTMSETECEKEILVTLVWVLQFINEHDGHWPTWEEIAAARREGANEVASESPLPPPGPRPREVKENRNPERGRV